MPALAPALAPVLWLLPQLRMRLAAVQSAAQPVALLLPLRPLDLPHAGERPEEARLFATQCR